MKDLCDIIEDWQHEQPASFEQVDGDGLVQSRVEWAVECDVCMAGVDMSCVVIKGAYNGVTLDQSRVGSIRSESHLDRCKKYRQYRREGRL